MKRTMLVSLVLLVSSACGEDNPKQDAGPRDAGIDSPADASCFDNPQTHYEIINSCTTAQKIYKDSKPPLLKADGTLPSLPP